MKQEKGEEEKLEESTTEEEEGAECKLHANIGFLFPFFLSNSLCVMVNTWFYLFYSITEKYFRN